MYDNDNLSFEQVYVLLIIGVIGIAVWLVAGGFNRQIPDAAPACVASQSSNSAYSSFYGSGYRRRCGLAAFFPPPLVWPAVTANFLLPVPDYCCVF